MVPLFPGRRKKEIQGEKQIPLRPQVIGEKINEYKGNHVIIMYIEYDLVVNDFAIDMIYNKILLIRFDPCRGFQLVG